MEKLKFDTARYCRSNAGRMGQWCGQDVAGLIGEEVRLLKMADDLNQQGAEHMRDEMARLKGELSALKAAAKPVVKWVNQQTFGRYLDGSNHPDAEQKAFVTVAEIDELARLIGEGK